MKPGRGFGKVAIVLLVVLIALMSFVVPAAAETATPPTNDGISGVPFVSPENRAEIDKMSAVVRQAVHFEKDGTVALDSDALKQLNSAERAVIERLVSDLNTGEIGILVQNPDGSTTTYGRIPDMSGTTSPDWIDWNGIHIYFNSWWTSQLINFNWTVIGAVVGVVSGQLCAASAYACAVFVAVATNVVLNMIWNYLRPYFPDSFTLHFPWWGWATVQLWRSGAWYNGRHFGLGIWT